jgi:3-hydroxyisobutyrate dehydrogenase-like beta-hydroxyacid dehydrogenase
LIGLLHPGAMGTALGSALVGAGQEVAWCSAGRSADTAHRAAAAGFTDVATIQRLLSSCSMVVAVCPPEGAVELATEVSGYEGVYVDANAISPATAERIGQLVSEGGGSYVDASIIGLPPTAAGQTRLYLSGAQAETVAAAFAGSWFDARVIGSDASRASALKMAYAGWTKGSTALLLAISAMASELGVAEVLHAEWDESQPGLTVRAEQAAASVRDKAWRWIFEMAEVGHSLDAVGLPGDFGRAAAAIYEQVRDERS